MPHTAFVYNEDCLDHDTGLGHPERAERLRAILEGVRASPVAARLEWLRAQPATLEAICRVHARHYVRWVEETCLSGFAMLDKGETTVCPDSFMVAMLSAGAAIDAVDWVLGAPGRNAFAATRPPGHHARRSEAMGFCIFNNIAIAAAHAKARYGLERVLIVDWDVHHGNGTQEMFFADGSVLFCSMHQYPLWPMTGHVDECGLNGGLGYTLNVPVPGGATIEAYREAIAERLIPAAAAFQPELVLVSAGWDAHACDPLATVNLDDADFNELTRGVMEIAATHAGGRLVSLLEGGYDTAVLRRCVVDHLQLLASQ